MTEAVEAPPWRAPRPGRGSGAKSRGKVVATRLDPLRHAVFAQILAETGMCTSDLLLQAVDEMIERAWRRMRAVGGIAAAGEPEWPEA